MELKLHVSDKFVKIISSVGNDTHIYFGEIQDGAYHGKGVSSFDSLIATYGHRIHGSLIKDDKRSGQGIQKNSDGSTYHGKWLSDMRHGNGILISASNVLLHNGEWQNDEFVG